VVLFAAGIVAARRDVLSGLSYRVGRRWLWLGWLVGVSAWLVLMRAGMIAGSPAFFFGGLHWQAAGYALWESFFCVAMSVGLLVTFRERHDAQGRLGRFLSENAFAVYVFHPPILVAITVALRGVQAVPLAKLVLAAVLVLPATFGVSHALRRVPALRRLFT
jgi:surface polysaccharide O-acyltransferase-like enzyme